MAALLARAASNGLRTRPDEWRSAVTLVLASVPPLLAVSWRAALASPAGSITAALVACLAAEDDLLLETLAALGGVTQLLLALCAEGLAPMVCPCALLAHLCEALGCDSSVLLDLLLDASAGQHLLELLCAAGRAGPRWRKATSVAARRCVAALQASVGRLSQTGAFPYNATVLQGRLAALGGS